MGSSLTENRKRSKKVAYPGRPVNDKMNGFAVIDKSTGVCW